MAGNKGNNSRTSTLLPRASINAKQKTKGSRTSGKGAPTAIGTRGINSGPSVVGGPRGSTRVTHSEYIGDLTTTTLGTVSAFVINASNPATFPWLSRIAQGYELYRFRRLRIEYCPSCSSSTSGVVVGAFEYDANDPAPVTKQQLSAIDGSVRTNIWSPVVWNFKPFNNWAFCSSPNSAPGDLRLSDIARFFIATFGAVTGGVVVGDLMVSYDVEFMKPEMAPSTLSEYLQPLSSTLPTLAGTGVSLAGDKVFTVSSPAPGKLDLTFSVGGQYMIVIGADGTATSGPSGLFTSPGDLYRGTDIIPASTQTLENTCTFTVANGSAYGTFVLSATVAVGDILRLYAAAVFTAMTIRRVRAGQYRYAIA